jgi:two-component system response regulator HupR/HoxA
MLARAIHYCSRRADKAFVIEHCGALPDQLLEAELFGYKRGAFTGAYEDRSGRFQQADGGTIFLDEIGDTSPVFQVKLLRVLQEGEFRPLGAARPHSVDVRVVAATHHDLEADVRAGTFREDLYYRLATVTLHVPALRERAMDIPLLAGRLLEASQKAARQERSTASAPRRSPVSPPIPGRATCASCRTRSCACWRSAESPRLGADLLAPRILRTPAVDQQPDDLLDLIAVDGGLKERMEALEARVLKETLIRHRWNKSRAASELGLSRVGLRNKLLRYGLERA